LSEKRIMPSDQDAQASTGPGRLLAIGDIHGCADELAAMLHEISPTASDTIVFLGDYVDRGSAARGVIDQVLALRESERCATVCLRGNHEDMFLDFLGQDGSHGDVFLFNGGRETLASYGVRAGSKVPDVLALIPPAHLAFLNGLEFSHVVEPFLFVHAGISPLRPLAEQRREDVLWIREEFIRNKHRLPQTVVFGHTPQREVFWHLPYKIGLDTGCVYGNRLSCLDFTSRELLQVDRGSCRIHRSAAPPELPVLLRPSA
jgi:serine/threonine protein phosphatase 1